MNRNYRKGFAFLLALMLVFSLVPGNVAYGIPPGSQIQESGADPITELPARLTDGAIWTDKSVVDNKDGTFDITLKAIGQSYKLEVPKPRDLVDVVFVLDVSGSMLDNNKLTNMKTAAKNAIEILLGTEVMDNRVAIVKYDEMASIVS